MFNLKSNKSISVGINNVKNDFKFWFSFSFINDRKVITKCSKTRFEFIVTQSSSLFFVKMPLKNVVYYQLLFDINLNFLALKGLT